MDLDTIISSHGNRTKVDDKIKSCIEHTGFLKMQITSARRKIWSLLGLNWFGLFFSSYRPWNNHPLKISVGEISIGITLSKQILASTNEFSPKLEGGGKI